MQKKRRGQVLSWCLFDFANSSYSAVIAAVVFPVYYVSIVVGDKSGLGDLWWGRAVSLSMAFVAITSPFLGGIADYSGKRKHLLFIYTLLSVTCVASLSFLKQGMVLEGFLLVLLANIGMEGGLVFYNSYLPEIAEKEFQGRVSAWGYAVGYAGSIISLLMVLPLIKRAQYGAAWLTVAAFFLIFSLPTFLFLKQTAEGKVPFAESAIKGGRYSWRTLKTIWRRREVRRFLLAFFIYDDGINTVIVFSSIFAATTLGFRPEELVALYMIVQVTALCGAFFMARPIDYWGPKKVVALSLVMWAGVAIAAFLIYKKIYFFALACCAGLGLGTVQAGSRAFFAQFIPPGRESEYFGVYALVGKSSSVAGPLFFGYISSTFGSQRPAILSVSAFFVAGLLILRGVRGGCANAAE